MESIPIFMLGNPDGASLTLDAPMRDTYRATLHAPELTVAATIQHIGGDFLGRFFQELARDWRGWEGARTWHSLEHQLSFEASHSKTGAIGLRVLLRDSSYDAWQIRYDLGVENGDLDRLARDSAAFGQHLGAAT
jgi:hypothetical protein